jgi:hypothetical protein
MPVCGFLCKGKFTVSEFMIAENSKAQALIAVFNRVVTLKELKIKQDKLPQQRNPTAHEVAAWKDIIEERLARSGIPAPRYEVVTLSDSTLLRAHVDLSNKTETDIAFLEQTLRLRVMEKRAETQYQLLPFSYFDRK